MDHDVGCRRFLVQFGFQPVALLAQFLAGGIQTIDTGNQLTA